MAVFAKLGDVERPGRAGMEPVGAFHGAELTLAVILHQPGELAARERVSELLIEFACALSAHGAVVQLAQHRTKLPPV